MSLPVTQKKIAGAFLVGVACVALAWTLRPTPPTPTTPSLEAVAVNVAAQRKFVEVPDSNQDGIPDWQEALQKTEPLETTARDEAYELPNTLTQQFAIEFFEEVVNNKEYGEFGDSPDELLNQTSDALARQAVDELIEVKDITIGSDNSPAALAQYGATIAAIISTYQETTGENEAAILDRAVRLQSEAELAKLDPKIVAYSEYLTRTKEVVVPPTAVAYHLDLLNTYQALLSDIQGMRATFTDPMYSLLRLKRYQDDASGLYVVITNLYQFLINNGAQWPENSVVYDIISVTDTP